MLSKSTSLTLRVEKACKEWNGKPLFSDISFELFHGEKVALFGQNGVGKTSLLNAIMGRVELDGGTVHLGVPLSEWGWLEQDLQVPDSTSLVNFVKSGHKELSKVAARLSELEERLEHASDVMQRGGSMPPDNHDANGPEPAGVQNLEVRNLIEEYSHVQAQYEALGGYAFETQVEMALTRLELPKEVWRTPYRALSGGQKTRAQLARLTIRKPKALILDEPTNHLDAETLRWLDDWLHQFEGTVLFVTHDRTLMDAVADAIILLTPNGCTRYKGGYKDFKAARDLEIRTQTALYNKQQREQKELLEAIHRYQQWYQQAHEAAGERNPYQKKRAMKNATRFKAKQRELERLESRRVERPREGLSAQVEFENTGFEARTLAALKDVSVRFGARQILFDVNLEVERTQRFAILGRNGAGKTTLLKTLSGQLAPPFATVTGEVTQHPELSIGYFEQELSRQDPKQTILDTLLSLPRMTQSLARTILAGFLFRKEDVFKPIGTLSMGERCRVAFVQLYLSGANLLVLDEPTNYLDVDTRERVEEALLDYPGALLLVTHDLYLLRKVANRIAVIEDGRVSVFDGSYDEYVASRHAPKYQDRETENQVRQLELSLTQLVSEEEPTTDEEKQALVQKIFQTREELARLRALQL